MANHSLFCHVRFLVSPILFLDHPFTSAPIEPIIFLCLKCKGRIILYHTTSKQGEIPGGWCLRGTLMPKGNFLTPHASISSSVKWVWQKNTHSKRLFKAQRDSLIFLLFFSFKPPKIRIEFYVVISPLTGLPQRMSLVPKNGGLPCSISLFLSWFHPSTSCCTNCKSQWERFRKANFHLPTGIMGKTSPQDAVFQLTEFTPYWYQHFGVILLSQWIFF